MTLLADLEEFVHDHRPHGSMTADATAPAWNGYMLTVTCSCGMVFERWITPDNAELDTGGSGASPTPWRTAVATREAFTGGGAIARVGSGGSCRLARAGAVFRQASASLVCCPIGGSRAGHVSA